MVPSSAQNHYVKWNCLPTQIFYLFGAQDRKIGTFSPSTIDVKWHRTVSLPNYLISLVSKTGALVPSLHRQSVSNGTVFAPKYLICLVTRTGPLVSSLRRRLVPNCTVSPSKHLTYLVSRTRDFFFHGSDKNCPVSILLVLVFS